MDLRVWLNLLTRLDSTAKALAVTSLRRKNTISNTCYHWYPFYFKDRVWTIWHNVTVQFSVPCITHMEHCKQLCSLPYRGVVKTQSSKRNAVHNSGCWSFFVRTDIGFNVSGRCAIDVDGLTHCKLFILPSHKLYLRKRHFTPSAGGGGRARSVSESMRYLEYYIRPLTLPTT